MLSKLITIITYAAAGIGCLAPLIAWGVSTGTPWHFYAVVAVNFTWLYYIGDTLKAKKA